MGARGSMPLVDEVILSEDYQADTTVLDSISNLTSCEDMKVCWGDGGEGCQEKVISARMVTYSCQLVL